jgi:hypothetical protein
VPAEDDEKPVDSTAATLLLSQALQALSETTA